MEKYRYAAGMPGYGAPGIDGSTGLGGIAFYVTTYNATNTEAKLTIKGRLANNEDLIDTSLTPPKIAGYDEGRRYQNGDYFIDSTSRIWEIDFTEADFFKDTNATIGGGENIFEETIDSSIGGAPYTRWANDGEGATTKLVVDTFISSSYANYITLYGPSSIYNNAISEYGHIFYNDLPSDNPAYISFNVWTSANSVSGYNEKAIALVRTISDNNWRLGNWTTVDGIRAVTLSLDFKKVGVNLVAAPTKPLEVGGDLRLNLTESITDQENGLIINWNGTDRMKINDNEIAVFGTGTSVAESLLLQSTGSSNNKVYIGWPGSSVGSLYVESSIYAAKQIISAVATGVAPFSVASTTRVANLTATNASTATIAITGNNILGGAQASIPYQIGANITTMLAKGTAGQFLKMNIGATAPEWSTSTPGVGSVGTTLPIENTGTSLDPVIAIAKATVSINGYLSSSDWNIFNSKAGSAATFYIGTTQIALGQGSGTISSISGLSISGNAGTVTGGVYLTGNQTIAGIKTFTSTIDGSINGNAGTVTGGVYTSGTQTIAGSKTFSTTITGSITGNAGTVTGGVYLTGNQTIAGIKTFTSTIDGSINGTATGLSTTLDVSRGGTGLATVATNNILTGNGVSAMTAESGLTYSGTVLAVSGDITATGNITAYFSDIRLKTNIVNIPNALDKVNSLNGFTFNPNELAAKIAFQNVNNDNVGISAQDLQKILPEAVKPAPFDIDASGDSKSGENYLTVQYEKIVPLLIEAIKELTKEINELKQKINNL